MIGTLLAGALGTIFYVGAVLLPTIMEEQKVISPTQGFIAIILMGLLDAVFVFVSGVVVKYVSIKNLLILSNLVGLLLLYPSFYIKIPIITVFMIAIYGTVHGIGYSPLAATLSALFLKK